MTRERLCNLKNVVIGILKELNFSVVDDLAFACRIEEISFKGHKTAPILR